MKDEIKHILAGKRRTHLLRLTPMFFMLLTVATAAAQKPAESIGQSRSTSLDGTRIHYMNYGKGHEALVLVHGWSCKLDFWRDQIPDFAETNRGIAIDLS